MDIRPDSRHLAGGMVVFLLMTTWMVYNGIAQPGRTYYQPEYSLHASHTYDVPCAECHTKPFQSAANEGCEFCHPGGARKRPIPVPKNLPPGVEPPKQIPQSHAAVQLHKLVAAQLCGECHIEHAHSELAEFLAQVGPERVKHPKYPDNVHKFIPESAEGEQNCTKCHEPTELEVKDDVVALNGN